jgi:hypothetical protein
MEAYLVELVSRTLLPTHCAMSQVLFSSIKAFIAPENEVTAGAVILGTLGGDLRYLTWVCLLGRLLSKGCCLTPFPLILFPLRPPPSPACPAFFKFFGIFAGSVLVGLIVGGGAAFAFKSGFFYAEPLPMHKRGEDRLYARKHAIFGGC